MEKHIGLLVSPVLVRTGLLHSNVQESPMSSKQLPSNLFMREICSYFFLSNQ